MKKYRYRRGTNQGWDVWFAFDPNDRSDRPICYVWPVKRSGRRRWRAASEEIKMVGIGDTREDAIKDLMICKKWEERVKNAAQNTKE